jgi:uncharacterized protein
VVLSLAGCGTDAPDLPDQDEPSATEPPSAPPGASEPDDRSAPTDESPGEPDVPPLHPDIDGWDAAVVTLRGATEAARVDVRVATSAAQRRRGLMRVPELPDGSGMLFVFEEERTGAFWMKDTLVPLDIAFAAADGTIRATLTMTPCEADPCPVYDPGVPYTMALEVPAGWFVRNGIAPGDVLRVDEAVGSAFGLRLRAGVVRGRRVAR